MYECDESSRHNAESEVWMPFCFFSFFSFFFYLILSVKNVNVYDFMFVTVDISSRISWHLSSTKPVGVLELKCASPLFLKCMCLSLWRASQEYNFREEENLNTVSSQVIFQYFSFFFSNQMAKPELFLSE